tara:strand:+ start:1397 stop:2629 length:1233 start_codon:yes stop_codon:yes gene_type:complete
MAIYKEISPEQVKTAKSFLNQLVDVIQEDISGSNTRKKYQVFVTGGVGPGVTSSLFHTVYDQDFSLSTANPIFDMTVGLYESGSTVTDAKTGIDSAGKLLFPSHSLMMREKTDIYRQFAQSLLGNADSQFYAPADSTSAGDAIDEAMFICFKRLFARDQIKRETFAMNFFMTASVSAMTMGGFGHGAVTDTNLTTTSTTGSAFFTDIGSAQNKSTTFGGSVSHLVASHNTDIKPGLIFYDRGVIVLDLAKAMSGSQHAQGQIAAVNAGGKEVIGYSGTTTPWNEASAFIPDLMVSGSIDDILDHIGSCRMSSGSNTAMTFQNVTNINSTLIFCRAGADEFNYSANPTYVNNSNRIRVIDAGQEENQRSFTFVTGIGLYDANDNLLAVAKLSRPVEKNDEKDVTFRIRLDF